jgi:3-oxoacyl-[acyl-carrier-protein] synthase II
VRKVLVTGIGAVTPLGADFPRTIARLMEGRGAASPVCERIRKFLPKAIAAQVESDVDARLAKAEQSVDRATKFALLAARDALADASLELADDEHERAGVYSGIGMGGAATMDLHYERFYSRVFDSNFKGNPAIVHPFTVPTAMSNATVAWLSIHGGFRGPTQTYSVACSSSAVALGEAYRAIKHGYADVIVVVGAEAMLSLGPIVAWHGLHVLAPPAADVAASCRPFSRDRNGFVLGEGAAAIVLESEARARRRGRTPYCELAGYGTSSDASHITMPSTPGQARAMRLALEDADCPPERVGYINAHGTATDAGDVSETAAIRAVYGPHASRLAVSSTKSMHGHLIGGAGALEFAITANAIRTGQVPPTAYLHDVDPRCDLDYVPNTGRDGVKLDAAVSNSFAFGGTNVSLLARRHAPTAGAVA